MIPESFLPFTSGAGLASSVQQPTVPPPQGMEQQPLASRDGLQHPQPDQQHWSLSAGLAVAMLMAAKAAAAAMSKMVVLMLMSRFGLIPLF